MKKQGNPLSIYNKGQLTSDKVLPLIGRLAVAFPQLDNNWFKVLKERLIANNFTDERFEASVNHVIDTFQYGKTPNIAEFISFDKEIEAFTYEQILEKLKEDKLVFLKYTMVNLNGLKRYVRNEEVEFYQLKKWSSQ